MKHVTLFSGKRLFLRLALAVIMIATWEGQVWADTTIFGGTIASGWVYKNSNGTTLSLSANNNLYEGGSINSPRIYESQSNITISSGQKIEIIAKRASSDTKKNFPSIKVKYSSDNGENWTESIEFTEIQITSKDYTNTVETSITPGEYKLKFEFAWAEISSIILKDAPDVPILSVDEELDFGTVRSDDSKTVMVYNTGVGNLSVDISSDNETDFTISTESLSDIAGGGSKSFTVSFNYDAEDLGEKSANITITPDVGEAKTITVTANSIDSRIWEDFSEGIPTTWYNEDNSWTTSASEHSGVAYQTYNSTKILRTPRLTAITDESISFDVSIGGTTSSYKIIAEYSNDGKTWNTIDTYTTSGTKSFDAPSTDNYWIRFTGYYSSVDNMMGWTVPDAIHLTKLGTATIPTTGLHHGTYTATVNVMELGGSNESVTAKLYFGDRVVATEEIAISGNQDETISLSYTPVETWSGKVYIEVTGENIETQTTSQKSVTISAPTVVLDETGDTKPTASTSALSKVIQVKYTPKAGWGTICLPCSLKTEHLNTIFGEGWTAYVFSGYSDGQLTFSKTKSFTNSKPYLIYAPNAEASDDGFYLQDVYIYSSYWTSPNVTHTINGVTFQGTFDPMAAGSLEGCYGVTGSGQIAKAGSKTQMNGYRAYFSTAAEVKMFVIDGDDATDIGLMQMVEGEDKAVYNISGQRVQKARKGLYIIGGKKVIIK